MSGLRESIRCLCGAPMQLAGRATGDFGDEWGMYRCPGCRRQVIETAEIPSIEHRTGQSSVPKLPPGLIETDDDDDVPFD